MALDDRYCAKDSEKRWQEFWQEKKIYQYDKDSDKETFSIDTPPPTVSGKLHIGHVFSYTQAEVIARYHRMLGKNVMYPFGFDDNGLPTEILTEREKGVKGSQLARKDFVDLCQDVSAKYREQFKDLWQSLGFSCDWNSAYSTISQSSQRISQRSFLDLLQKNLVEYKQMPTLWCTHCQTSFAQAEVEDVPKATIFNYLNFYSTDGVAIPIATTRPELLAGCVAMFIHPKNMKYKNLIGQETIVPLFGHKVKIIADEKADPEKGTGIVMCCTFGDVTDIDWWRQHSLDSRICFTVDGKMNEIAGEFEGLTIKEARQAIINKLLEEKIIFKQEDLAAESRIVNRHERCGTSVEYLNTKQWFIKVVDKKNELIAQGRKINWYPNYMRKRYEDWVGNLGWNWAISRQRYFGVPIPIWYAPDGKIIPASLEQLPVNPLVDKPLDCQGYNPDDLIAERDVLDTWATSSITPELNARWGEVDEDKKNRPMSMRPQAHDIIRTWAFYTIVKSYYHFNSIPWKNAVISGHVIKPTGAEVKGQALKGKAYERKAKISKSKDGDNFSPIRIIDEFGADVVRYWTCSGALGTDITFDKTEILTVNKLLTKLWNCSRFAEGFLRDFTNRKEVPELTVVDEWILNRFCLMSNVYHKSFEKYEFFTARNELEKFFWSSFCDNYLELIKDRLWNPENYSKDKVYSAQWTLYQVLMGQLKLFAPFIPHITEDIYQEFKQEDDVLSIHISSFVKIAKNDSQFSQEKGDLLLKLIIAIRSYKSKNNYSLKLPIEKIILTENFKTKLQGVEKDLKTLTKITEIEYNNDIDLSDYQNTIDFAIMPASLENPVSSIVPIINASDIYIIHIIMDKGALKRQDAITKLKSTINALKQEKGLKAKSPIKRILVSAPLLKELLSSEPAQIKAAAKAEEVSFEEFADGQKVDGYDDVRIKLEFLD